MHRFRSWTLDPPEWRTQRNRALSLEGGDGSSLNVDFTTGVLDPKLSHSRGSNATFINSSGLVEWANSNMALRSDIMQTTVDGVSDGTQWNPGVGYTVSLVSTTRPDGSTGNVRRLQNTTGAGSFFNAAPISVIPGQRYTFSFWARNNGGSQARIRVWNNTASSSIIDHTQPQNNYIDDIGGAGNTSTTWVRIFRTFVIPAGCNAISIYPSSHDSGTVDLYVFGAQLNYGSIPGTYLSTTNTVNGNTPRFDYNPTTLESNGLLIEGNVTNLCTYSGDMTQSGAGHWSVRTALVTTSWTGLTAPDGTASAVKIIPDTTSNRHTLESSSTTITSGLVYTASAFVKADGYSVVSLIVAGLQTRRNFTLSGNGTVESQFGLSNTATITPVGSNGWYRVTMTWTANFTGNAGFWIGVPQNASTDVTTAWSGNGTSGIQAWGAQLETGSGASSYIPTGASSVTRVNDSVTFNDRNWFTSWKSTWFADYKVFNCAGLPTFFYARSSQDAFNNYLNIVSNNTNSLTSVLSRSNSNAVQQWSTNNPLLSITSEFNKCAWVIDDTAKIAHAGVIDYTSTSGRSLPLGSGLSAYEIALNPTVGTSCSMWLRSLKYYPKALNNVELINLTKPTIPNTSLDLNFTSGTLSSLLTFTRGSNATFINSSGLVKYAKQNLFFNTNFAGISGSNPTLSNVGWSYGFTAGTATFNGDGSVTMSASGGRCTINRITSFAGSGRRIIVSIDITSNGDTGLIPTQLLRDSTLTNSVYYINSNLYTSGTVVGPCTLTFVADSPTAGNSTPFFGVGTSGNVTATVTFARPRFGLWDGTFPLPYVVNTSSGASPSEYHGPRFDHDPTSIGTPLGLLIEGSSDNQLRNSNDIYNTSFWGSSVGVSATQDTTIPDPSGGTTTCKIVKSAGVQYVVRNQPIPTLTVPANSTVNLTASVWLRMDGAGQVSPHLGIYDAAGASFGTRSGASVSNSAVTIDSSSAAIAAYTFGSVTGWVRCSVSRSFTNSTASPVTFTQLSFYIYPNQVNTNAATIYAWGAQVESGVGASSLIPTGASTVKREAESCALALSAFPFVISEGSFVVRYDAPRANLGASLTSILNTDYQATKWIGLFQGVNSVIVSLGSWSGQSNISAGTVTSNIAAFSYGAWTGSLVPVSFVVNNSAVTNATRDWNPALPTWLMIGAASPGGSSTAGRDWLNSCIRSVKYWPTRLTNNQLKYLSGS